MAFCNALRQRILPQLTCNARCCTSQTLIVVVTHPRTSDIRNALGNRIDYVATHKEGKVFFGREPPNGESTTTILCGQLSTTCSNVTQVAQWAASSCSRPQPAMDNDVRDCRSN